MVMSMSCGESVLGRCVFCGVDLGVCIDVGRRLWDKIYVLGTELRGGSYGHRRYVAALLFNFFDLPS